MPLHRSTNSLKIVQGTGEAGSFHVKHCANYPGMLKRTLLNRVIGPENSAIYLSLPKCPESGTLRLNAGN